MDTTKHGNTGKNFLTQPDLTQKITWPKPDFFDPKQKRVDPWPDPIFYGSTRPDLDNLWPDPLKKNR